MKNNCTILSTKWLRALAPQNSGISLYCKKKICSFRITFVGRFHPSKPCGFAFNSREQRSSKSWNLERPERSCLAAYLLFGGLFGPEWYLWHWMTSPVRFWGLARRVWCIGLRFPLNSQSECNLKGQWGESALWEHRYLAYLNLIWAFWINKAFVHCQNLFYELWALYQHKTPFKHLKNVRIQMVALSALLKIRIGTRYAWNQRQMYDFKKWFAFSDNCHISNSSVFSCTCPCVLISKMKGLKEGRIDFLSELRGTVFGTSPSSVSNRWELKFFNHQMLPWLFEGCVLTNHFMELKFKRFTYTFTDYTLIHKTIHLFICRFDLNFFATQFHKKIIY